MADTKISALTELTGASVDAAADVLPIVDTGSTATKKIKVEELVIGASATQAQVNAMTSTKTVLTPFLNKIVLGTEVATTSGTTVEIATSIPAGVRRIILLLDGVSTNGSSNYLIQIGDSGGYETTGYSSESSTDGGTRGLSTAGFIITGTNAASYTTTGVVTLHLANSSHKWFAEHTTSDQVNAGQQLGGGVGVKTLSAELDRIRITTVSGDTFDAGNITPIFER